MVDLAEFYSVELFKKYCDEYLAAVTITAENVFPLIELAEKYSMIFKWCETQARDKQTVDDNLNLRDTIKAEIFDILPINFKKMELKFLHEFVVARGYIFNSFEELSKILSDRLSQPQVKVTNSDGQTLHGNVIPDTAVIENIKSIKLSPSFLADTYILWNTGFKSPSTPSPLKERDGIEWYLVCCKSGYIGIFNHRHVDERCYLLAELTPGSSGFGNAYGCKIEETE